MLLGALSTWVWDIPKEGDVWMDNLLLFVTIVVKFFFITSSWNIFCCNLCPLPLACCAPPRRIWFPLICSLLLGSLRQQWVPLPFILLKTDRCLSLSVCILCFSPLVLIFRCTHSYISIFFLKGEPQTEKVLQILLPEREGE